MNKINDQILSRVTQRRGIEPGKPYRFYVNGRTYEAAYGYLSPVRDIGPEPYWRILLRVLKMVS